MVMGPTCGMVLADLGAEVIKVEPLGRRQARARLLGSGAGFFPLFNRNKKSVALDLQTPRGPRGRAAADRHGRHRQRELQARHDEEAGPGLRQRSRKLNPRLIYVSHKGFLPGPYDHRTALDEVVQMMGGLAYMTGRPGDPLRAGTSVNDIMGGMFGAIGAMAALAPAREDRQGPGGAERAVREQRVPGRAAHDAVRGHRQAGRAHARPHLGLGACTTCSR